MERPRPRGQWRASVPASRWSRPASGVTIRRRPAVSRGPMERERPREYKWSVDGIPAQKERLTD